MHKRIPAVEPCDDVDVLRERARAAMVPDHEMTPSSGPPAHLYDRTIRISTATTVSRPRTANVMPLQNHDRGQ